MPSFALFLISPFQTFPSPMVFHKLLKYSFPWKLEFKILWSLPMISSRLYFEISQNLSLTLVIFPFASVNATIVDWSRAKRISILSLIVSLKCSSACFRFVISERIAIYWIGFPFYSKTEQWLYQPNRTCHLWLCYESHLSTPYRTGWFAISL